MCSWRHCDIFHDNRQYSVLVVQRELHCHWVRVRPSESKIGWGDPCRSWLARVQGQHHQNVSSLVSPPQIGLALCSGLLCSDIRFNPRLKGSIPKELGNLQNLLQLYMPPCVPDFGCTALAWHSIHKHLPWSVTV